MKYIYSFLILVLLTLLLIFISVPDNNLHIIACNVGEGDTILIIYKSTEILVDGGPDNKVLNCLSKFIPFWDKDIELVISTHPDADHSTGLIDVLKSYRVKSFAITAVDSGTKTYELLKKVLGGEGINIIKPYTGMKLGNSLIQLDVVHPPIGFETTKGTNDYSTTFILHYKNFSGLFPGDLDDNDINLVSTSMIPKVNYLKVPHHGSKNGLSQALLDASDPQIAVISVGKNNSYGHPNKEILNMLEAKGVKIERTDEVGDIEVVSNGNNWWLK